MDTNVFGADDATASRPGAVEQERSNPVPPDDTPRDFFVSQRLAADLAAKRFDDQVEGNRKRADLWGKSVLAVGTAMMGAFGIGELTDLLPLDNARLQFAATALLVLAIAAVWTIGIRLNKVSEPVVMRASIEDMQHTDAGLRSAEVPVVEKIYDRFRRLNGVHDVAEYASIATVIESTFTELASRGFSIAEIATLTDAERRTHEQHIVAKLMANEELPLIEPSPDGTSGTSGHAAGVTGQLAAGQPTNGGSGSDTRGKKPDRDPTYNREDLAGRRRAVIERNVRYALRHPVLAEQKAALVRSELRYVMNHALSAVVRKRAVSATTDMYSIGALAAIPIGILGAVLITYYANAEAARNNRDLQQTKSCVEIAALIAEHQLVTAPISLCSSLNPSR